MPKLSVVCSNKSVHLVSLVACNVMLDARLKPIQAKAIFNLPRERRKTSSCITFNWKKKSSMSSVAYQNTLGDNDKAVVRWKIYATYASKIKPLAEVYCTFASLVCRPLAALMFFSLFSKDKTPHSSARQ